MKAEKREKIIKWTREEKNKLKIIIPCIVIAIIVFSIFVNETNWGKKDASISISILFDLVFFVIFYIWIIWSHLFKTKEEVLRKNKISLVIFSNDELWQLILACFITPIAYIEIVKISGITIKIIITIIVIIFIIAIGNIISKQFKKKLK